MSIEDILMLIALIASVTINILYHLKLKNIYKQLARQKRIMMKYKAELGTTRDYEYDEECYKGIGGGDR